jgi:hypothetical protein
VIISVKMILAINSNHEFTCTLANKLGPCGLTYVVVEREELMSNQMNKGFCSKCGTRSDELVPGKHPFSWLCPKCNPGPKKEPNEKGKYQLRESALTPRKLLN